MMISFQRTRIFSYNSPGGAILPMLECKLTSSEMIGKQYVEALANVSRAQVSQLYFLLIKVLWLEKLRLKACGRKS